MLASFLSRFNYIYGTIMPRRRTNFGSHTRRTEARRRVIANQNEEQRGSANDRYRQIMAQIRSEEAAERRAARLEDALLRARRSSSAASEPLRSQQNERDTFSYNNL